MLACQCRLRDRRSPPSPPPPNPLPSLSVGSSASGSAGIPRSLSSLPLGRIGWAHELHVRSHRHNYHHARPSETMLVLPDVRPISSTSVSLTAAAAAAQEAIRRDTSLLPAIAARQVRQRRQTEVVFVRVRRGQVGQPHVVVIRQTQLVLRRVGRKPSWQRGTGNTKTRPLHYTAVWWTVVLSWLARL
jgi:hypothetical protein